MEETRNATVSDNADAKEPVLYAKEFFDIPRHNLITGTAVKFFSEATAAKVQQLLDPLNEVFDDIGGWADEIKKSPANRPHDPETDAFLSDTRNSSHKQWHFVYLPLASASYAEAADLGFTRDHEEVQTIIECVSLRQGNSTRFS